jgi:hypothetical protein
MVEARRLPNGNILAPRRAEGPHGEIGDGLYEYRPGEAGYAVWDKWLRRTPGIDPDVPVPRSPR